MKPVLIQEYSGHSPWPAVAAVTGLWRAILCLDTHVGKQSTSRFLSKGHLIDSSFGDVPPRQGPRSPHGSEDAQQGTERTRSPTQMCKKNSMNSAAAVSVLRPQK